MRRALLNKGRGGKRTFARCLNLLSVARLAPRVSVVPSCSRFSSSSSNAMSSSHPLRERLQSNSPDPEVARPTTPLRINKHNSPRQGLSPRQPSSQHQIQVARRSSNSFRHVRENNLVTKSPFRLHSRIPAPLGASPSPRRVSGEKRPRPPSMHDSAENDKPLGPKRRQSKSFQGLLQKEPVTKSPFRASSDQPLDDLPPPLPPKIKLNSELPFQLPQPLVPAPSPIRSALADPRNSRMHGPRDVGQHRQSHRKTVTFDDKCDVLEFEVDGLADVSFDEDGYGYGYTMSDGYGGMQVDENGSYDSVDQVGNDSITGWVDSMLEDTRPHTPPGPEDEEDADLLPPSPSPAKPHSHSPPYHHQSSSPSTSCEYIFSPRLASHQPLSMSSSSFVNLVLIVIADVPPPEPYSPLQIKDEDPPFEDSFRSNRSSDSLDPSNLSIGNSEVSISNLDSHSLLVDSNFEGELPTSASFVPVASSSPRPRSHSGTPLERSPERSFDRSLDRSFEARSTPSLTPSRLNSTRSGSGSPFQKQLFKPSSSSSLGSFKNGRQPVTREEIRERMRRRSQDSLVRSLSGSPTPAHPTDVTHASEPEPVVHHEDEMVEEEADTADTSRITEPTSDAPTPIMPLMTRGNPTYDGVMSVDPEPQPIDPPRPTLSERAHSIDGTAVAMDAKRAFAGLELDFEHGFGLGEEGMSMSAGLMGSRPKHSSMYLGDVSALDKLMEDMAQGAGVDVSASANNTSIISEGQSYASLRVEPITEGVKAASFSLPAIEQDEGSMGIDLDLNSSGKYQDTIAVPVPVPTREFDSTPASSPPPPPPAKDAIRAREELIRAKRREARMEDEDDFDSPAPAVFRPAPLVRRRSMSTNDAEEVIVPRPAAPAATSHRRAASAKDDNLLDITALRGEDAPLADTINRELKKRENMKRSVSCSA